MPASNASESVDVGVNRCLRMSAETLTSLLFLSSISLTSFGGFMLYEWRKGEETQLHAVPGYIYLVLVLGIAASVSNAMSYMGACSRSVCLLSASLCLVFVVLLLEAVLALILFYDPALVDNKVCPPDDAACLARIDNLFKDPSAHAGAVVAVVCGAQLLALVVLLLLRRSTRLLYNDEENVDAVLWERGGLRRTLLEEQEWRNSRDEFEERSRQRVEQRHDKYRSLLSNVAREALAAQPQARPSASWDKS